MAKKVLSIVIGAECAKVCEVSYKKNYKNKGIRVYRSTSFPTPPDTIEDGYIRDKAAFGEELKNRLKTAKIKSDKVIFSITSSKIANREVIMPPAKEKRIMDIIKTGASEYFPIDMKDYVLSYQILEKDTSDRKSKAQKKKLTKKELKLAKKQEKQEKKALKKKSKTEIIADNMEMMEAKEREQASLDIDIKPEEGSIDNSKKQMRLSVYAAPSSLVKNYYSFAKLMHMDIISLDYSGNSSYQTIKRQAKRGTNVFVQMNEQDTLISILRDEVMILQRTVGYGLSSLIETVMEQGHYMVVDAAEALELLKARNLLSLEPENNDLLQFDSSWSKGEAAAASETIETIGSPRVRENEGELEAKRNIRESLHFLSNSIARMLDYYKSSHKQIDIDTIYITGSGVHIQGIEGFFSTEIGIPHKKMEKLATVSSRKKAATYRNSPSEFITCIGAVIEPVDFIPLEFTLKKQRRSVIIGTIIFTLACLAGSAGTIYVSFTDYMAAKQELEEANTELAAMPQLSGAHDEYNKELAELEDLQILEGMTNSHNDDIKTIIEEFEDKLPTNTVINSMQFTETDVTITMKITSNDIRTGANALIAKTLKQLKTIEYFKNNVTVISNTIEADSGISVVNLSVLCTYVQ